jgi:hypothetical protein
MTENGSESLAFEPPEQENIRLREENARLGRLLAAHSIPIPQLAPEKPPLTKAVEPAPPVDKEERARKRIALFRSLFRGREDVYARRWENDDGRHSYMPAHVKDWKAINKSRPEDRKKVAQKTRTFLPMTDAVIVQHLRGQETIGVYPLLFSFETQRRFADARRSEDEYQRIRLRILDCGNQSFLGFDEPRMGNGGSAGGEPAARSTARSVGSKEIRAATAFRILRRSHRFPRFLR